MCELLNAPLPAALGPEIDALAPLPLAVLILGETGAGKEVVARALHARSRRAHGPLLVVSCGTLSERGPDPFGGVDGALARARGGTLLLDEVSLLPPGAQAALLAALEAEEARRAADDADGHPQVLATSRYELGRAAEAERFRPALYHRLSAYTLRVPPLRERRAEIAGLARAIAAALSAEAGADSVRLTDEALALLARRDWPGNVRELRNVVAQAVVRARALRPSGALILDAADLGLPDLGDAMEPLVQILEKARRQALVDALARSGGNVREAGRLLGISRSLAYREAGRLGLLAGRARPAPRDEGAPPSSAEAAEPLDELGLG